MTLIEGKFPRRKRLLKPDEYRRVFTSNERSRDRNFMVLARANGLQYPRLGLAISKKKTSKAVDRNHLKRLIRESFRSHQHLLRGLDLIVINQRVDKLETNEMYYSSLSQHWQRLAEKCARS